MQTLYRIVDSLNPLARLVLALLCLVLSILLMLVFRSGISMVTLSLALVLVWDFFRNSSVWIAFRAFRRGESTQVPYLIGLVTWPRLLGASAQAYYHWMSGVARITQGNWLEAKLFLLSAASGAIRTENDRALIQCMLAETNLQLGAREEALRHLLLATRLEHHAEVDRVIEKLQQRINQAG